MTCKQHSFTTHIKEKSHWLYKAIYIIYPPIFKIRKKYRAWKYERFLNAVTSHAASEIAKRIDKDILDNLTMAYTPPRLICGDPSGTALYDISNSGWHIKQNVGIKHPYNFSGGHMT